ncbi:MAG: hypothetical protein ACTIMZ_09535 [Pseudoalteromonas distincta]|uniref:hypothetical protein n=1 Tax=Pseudoalteromonas distincta TaxID=77608 RepID=UPI00261D7B40|nr:hypothetical protein [uncultured Paraglaciecola sp.]
MAKQHPYARVVDGLKTRCRKNAEALTLLQFDWPVSRFVLERISEYITDHICADEEPVIYEIIEEALVRYSEAVHFKAGNKIPDPLRFAVFIEALISETSRIMEVEIVDNSGSSWTVGSGKSFCEWYSKHEGGLTIYPKLHESENSLRSVLYDLITSEQIKTVLRRVDYEEAIMAGGLATGN